MLDQINLLAVLVAAVSTFLLGGLWYSKALFGALWQRETGLTDAQVAAHAGRTFGVSFVLSVVAALTFALFLGKEATAGFGTAAGATAGLCWVASSFGINYLFETKGLTLFLVNGGYHTVQFTLIGLILGLWH
jgi:hypothetical protein